MLPEITLKGYQCSRCNHTWVPRDETTPLVCPKCKSPYWNKPRRIDLDNKETTNKIASKYAKVRKQK